MFAIKQRIQSRNRGQQGQSVTVLLIGLALLVVLPLGVFSFELSRYHLAKEQLKSCLDAAALAAAATTASSNVTDATATQNTAIATAMTMFQQETILDKSLASATQGGSTALNPGPNQAQVYFQFLDPVTHAVVPLGSDTGKIIQINGAFGVVPVFASFFGINSSYVATDISFGGLPMLDVVLCFDISSSMDDFTPITAVDRYSTGGATPTDAYKIVAQGPLYTAYHCSSSTGSGLNATWPQNLGSDGTISYSAANRGTNHGAIAPSTSQPNNTYTDEVVNLDGTNTENLGINVGGFNFPANNIGVLVEAARGNLESTTVATAAKVPYTTWGITPATGYYNAYKTGALAMRHPIQDAITAAISFFTIMNNDCDGHFGLVSFGTNEGSSSTSTIGDNPGNSISSGYSSGGYPGDPYTPTPPNPYVALIPTLGTSYSNFSNVNTAVTGLIAQGSTDIAGSLKKAILQEATSAQGGLNLCRPGATKAVVLFTDGLPTVSSLGGSPATDARTWASKANTYGIPVYCIGLCLTPGLQSAQTAMLTDTNSNPSTGGIAGISGNGAQFFQATSINELNLVFENVARSLVQLVR